MVICWPRFVKGQEIAELMRDPEIWRGAGGEWVEGVDWNSLVTNPGCAFFLAKDDTGRPVGYMFFERQNPACWEVHCGFRRESRGSFAKRIAITSIIYMKEIYKAKKIVARVQAWDRPTQVLVGACGAVREGYSPKYLPHQGQMRDVIYYGLTLE